MFRILKKTAALLALTCVFLCGCGKAAEKPAAEERPTPTAAPETPVPTPVSTAEPLTEAEPTPTSAPEPTARPMSLISDGQEVNSFSLNTGAEVQLSVLLPEDAVADAGTPVFSSSDESVASVDENGLISALTVGSAEIRCVLDGFSDAVCKITVSEPVKPTVTICFWETPKYDITMNASSSETVQLNAKISPATAETVVWSIGNPQVASVDDTGLVTALNEGSTQVTASCGGGKASCWIRVHGTRPAEIRADDSVYEGDARVAITFLGYLCNDFTVKVGESVTLGSKLYNHPGAAVTWTLKDYSVAELVYDETGAKVTGLKEGTTELVCTCGPLTSSCIVRVSK